MNWPLEPDEDIDVVWSDTLSNNATVERFENGDLRVYNGEFRGQHIALGPESVRVLFLHTRGGHPRHPKRFFLNSSDGVIDWLHYPRPGSCVLESGDYFYHSDPDEVEELRETTLQNDQEAGFDFSMGIL